MTRRRRLALAAAAVLLAGCLLPEHARIPVAGATPASWNPKSFWYEPWGKSGVHKGIDVFAPHGQPVISAVPGIVVYQGRLGIGGNVVAVLGPKWRVHYYAHLADGPPSPWLPGRGTRLGLVGTTGNAAGKPPHLHYAVVSLLPLPWRWSTAAQGWKRMFFLDPGTVLQGSG